MRPPTAPTPKRTRSLLVHGGKMKDFIRGPVAKPERGTQRPDSVTWPWLFHGLGPGIRKVYGGQQPDRLGAHQDRDSAGVARDATACHGVTGNKPHRPC